MSIPKPDHYRNKGQNLGRVVDGVFDPLNATGRNTGNLYEVDYSNMRKAMEDIRGESPALFDRCVTAMTGGRELSEADETVANKILNVHGYGVKSEMLNKVVAHWKLNAPSMSASFEPEYMLDVSRPVAHRFYEAAAEKVESIRERYPQFGKDLDDMLKSGDDSDAIFAERWFKDKHEGTERSSMARSFGYAVNSINGLNKRAAGTYAKLSPFDASKYEAEAHDL